jgi:hypothetical protein
MMFNS